LESERLWTSGNSTHGMLLLKPQKIHYRWPQQSSLPMWCCEDRISRILWMPFNFTSHQLILRIQEILVNKGVISCSVFGSGGFQHQAKILLFVQPDLSKDSSVLLFEQKRLFLSKHPPVKTSFTNYSCSCFSFSSQVCFSFSMCACLQMHVLLLVILFCAYFFLAFYFFLFYNLLVFHPCCSSLDVNFHRIFIEISRW